MGNYLEIPNLDKNFPFRTFTNDGEVLVYPHWHKEIEIIYVLRGSLNLGVNDVPIQMNAGEIQIINGGDVHYFLGSPNSERIVIQFDLAFFQQDKKSDEQADLRRLFQTCVSSSRHWDDPIRSKIRELILAIHEEEQKQKDGFEYATKAKMLEMLVLLYREVPKNEAIPDNLFQGEAVLKSQETLEMLDEIFSYIEQRYKEPIALQEMADLTGFSTYYFTKFFKRNTGMTFVTFLNDYRLNKAKWILINEAYPITEVAEMTGFSSVKTFHHAFKRAMGIAPLKFRKTIYEKNRTIK
ncbi:AraC family transcriptional regulator [Listeria goaensis]|uniref:AraC family transcriptional regulator n=1 Tax=Listeria goaensis TaxID=1649188 RepID=UPI000B594E7A|nr:AraC family transcriptional regulator [Listeria goaensis]